MKNYITTIGKIKEIDPYLIGRVKLPNFQNHEQVDVKTIAELNDLNNTLFALAAFPEHSHSLRLLACDFADTVLYLLPATFTKTVKTAKDFAQGKVNIFDLQEAHTASYEASEKIQNEWVLAATNAIQNSLQRPSTAVLNAGVAVHRTTLKRGEFTPYKVFDNAIYALANDKDWGNKQVLDLYSEIFQNWLNK